MTKKVQLLLACVVAVTAGTGLAARASADTTLQAEAMTFPSRAARMFSDPDASGGQALLVYRNATVSGRVDAEAADAIVIRARGDRCGGAPRMVVALDGTKIAALEVNSASWADHTIDTAVAPGAHDMTIAFTNDHRTKRCDRNLRLDMVEFAARDTTETLYVDPHSSAKAQADAWRSTRPADAALIDKIAAQAQGFWLGSWSGDVRGAVDAIVTAAGGEVPILVAYNIPQRDCGGYSSGGTTPDAYRTWIRDVAAGVGSREAIIVLEPDALASASCLSAADRDVRFDLLRDAVSVLKGGAATSVYIDAGHSHWLAAADAATRLARAGVADADGFSLNVSNFNTTSDEIAYGSSVASKIGGKHFVVDTSRNGLGSDGTWCNPAGRALGEPPTLSTNQPLVDAYLWVKRPGESDGPCNDGPNAGQWWAGYALGLAQRANW